MSKSQPIDKYLPKRAATRPVQAHVEEDLFNEMDSFRKAKKLTWSELVVGMFKRQRDENKTSK